MRNMLAFCLVISSVSTYFSSDYKLLLYGVYFFVLVQYLIFTKFLPIPPLPILIAVFFYFLGTVFSVVVNMGSASLGMFQTLIYPIVSALILSIAPNILNDLSRKWAGAIIIFFFMNAVVAFFSIAGILQRLPLWGEIVQGRFIFGTELPSSAGLIWNVNYYAVTQAVGFWLCFILYKYHKLSLGG